MTQEFHYCKHCKEAIAFDAVDKLWYHTNAEGGWWRNCQLMAQPQ
jgi:hypothetical protein